MELVQKDGTWAGSQQGLHVRNMQEQQWTRDGLIFFRL